MQQKEHPWLPRPQISWWAWASHPLPLRSRPWKLKNGARDMLALITVVVASVYRALTSARRGPVSLHPPHGVHELASRTLPTVPMSNETQGSPATG